MVAVTIMCLEYLSSGTLPNMVKKICFTHNSLVYGPIWPRFLHTSSFGLKPNILADYHSTWSRNMHTRPRFFPAQTFPGYVLSRCTQRRFFSLYFMTKICMSFFSVTTGEKEMKFCKCIHNNVMFLCCEGGSKG